MTDPLETLLQEVTALHAENSGLAAFCALPDDVSRQVISPSRAPSSDGMLKETRFGSTPYAPLTQALLGAADEAIWLQPYKGTELATRHMQDFACYEVIGWHAPFASAKMRSFVIYQPPHQHYPWHHHPAEELYVVLAGEAEFLLEGEAPKVLSPGDCVFHPSGTPHALTTHDAPVLAYVAWRNHFDVWPVWTEMETTP